MAVAGVDEHRAFAAGGERSGAGLRPVTLLVAAGAILAAAFIAAAVFAIYRLHEQALWSAEQELSRLDLVLAEQTDRSFQAVDLTLKNVVAMLQVRGIGSEDDYLRQVATVGTNRLLQSAIGGLPEIDALVLVAADGRVVASSRDRPTRGVDVAHRDFFRVLSADASRQSYVSAPVGSADNGVRKIYLARRVNGPHGEFLGLVLGAMRVDYFEDFYRTIGLGAHGSVTLLRTNAALLARYPARHDLLGKQFPGALFDRMNGAKAAVGNTASAIDGRHKIAAIRRLDHYPAAVMVTRDRRAALRLWHRRVIAVTIAAILAVLSIAALVLLMIRQLRGQAALAAARTARIEAEHARFVAEAELSKCERLSVLGQLTATVAHELRNPLSAIRNTLFSIKEIAATGGVRLERPVARMERSIARCDRIIGDLLDYTRHRELSRKTVELDRWVDHIAGEQHLAAGIEMVCDPGAGGARVAIDTDRMRRVIINLIDNAAQALGEIAAESAEKRIIVTTRAEGASVELTIADTGPGIAPENLARVFEPLFSTKSFGTGLGLATVKQIVTQHDGAITIDSEAGAGTRVTVRLPLVQPAEVAA